ncbi:hypothetical protein [Micromonospora sp. NPDC005203]|uniref:hypothetical protein n=1 Tax=Micromonospora sp. NPDC005203 TaxID=3364226 RepID=UPI00367FADB2
MDFGRPLAEGVKVCGVAQEGDAGSGDVIYQLCRQRLLRFGARVLVELAGRLKVSP